METTNGNPCGHLLDCLLGEAPDEARKAFERHLPGCPSCLQQWNEMTEVWNAMPFVAEEAEPPAGLKDDVMNAIFGTERPSGAEMADAPRAVADVRTAPDAAAKTAAIARPRRIRTYGIALAAAVLLIAASIWTVSSRFDEANVVNAVDQPLYVEQTYVLNASDKSMADARGTGWIVCQGNKKKLVLNVNGLVKTNDDEAYQVWLIHEGKRRNAGTFWVDPQGSGVLVYELPQTGGEFEAIGITLEPDSRGSAPRGKKVLGT